MSAIGSRGRLARPLPEPVEFALAYVALATLPLLDVVAPELAFHVGSALPRSVTGAVILTRAWFWVLGGMVLVGLVYAVARGCPLRLRPPARSDWKPLVVVALGPVLVAVGLAVVVHGLLGTTVATVTSNAAIPTLTPGFLWWNVLVPGLLVGIAYAVLFQGALQEHWRGVLGPREATLAIAALAGLYHWYVDPMWRLARSNALLLVALVFVVGTAVSAVELSRLEDADSFRAILAPTPLVALALAGVLGFTVVVDVLSGATTLGELLLAAAWLGVFGVAAWEYERTRSLWIPTISVALFQIALLGLPHLEAILGLAPGFA